MKEIDFLPEWYKSGIRRQVNYRMQYIILSGIFAVMMVWNFVSAGSVSKVKAKYMEMENMQVHSEEVSRELKEYKNEIAMLHEKEKILDSIDSKINVANVLAELSFLVEEKVVLSKVELISEKLNNQVNGMNSQSMSVVKSSVPKDNYGTLLGNVQFRIQIKGVAANGSDVAVLLCKIEDSPYFSHANLVYLKDSEVKNAKKNINVSEFEIGCYLSNYHESR